MLCKTKRSACCGNILNRQEVCDTNQLVLMLNTLQRLVLSSLHTERSTISFPLRDHFSAFVLHSSTQQNHCFL